MTELAVAELFVSIQGETTAAGLVCAFIRLAGCNLRCSYCDAAYAYQEPGKIMTLDDVLAWTAAQGARLVAVTGGEPLLQPATRSLLHALVAQRQHPVLLETNGSLSIADLPHGVKVILDVKTPGSGMAASFEQSNLERLRPGDELKFVLTGRQDYLWAKEFIHNHNLAGREILLSPASDSLAPAQLAEWLLADRLPYRLQLQLHKILWPGADRGR